MKNYFKENIVKYISIVSFLIFFILILIQYLNVFVCYDDYGFASLSYSNSIEGVRGLHYNLRQLIKFLYLYYIDWGGRVISFGTEALLLKNGVIVMQIAMALTVTLIMYFLYKIITIYPVKNKWFTAIAVCSLYGLIHIGMLRDSFYWYTSAVIYVMPFMPYLIGVYFYANTVNRQIVSDNNFKPEKNLMFYIKNILIAFILFIAAFSQEQVAISLSFMIASLMIYKYLILKKLNLWDYINTASTILGTLLVVFAPGNSKRMDEQINFYNSPLIARTLTNVDSIFKEVFGYKFIYIMTAYIMALALISMIMIIKNYGSKILNILFLLINMIILCLSLFLKMPLYAALENQLNKNLVMLLIFTYISFIIVQLTIYYLSVKKQIMLILFWASMCTIASMAFIPCITIRCYVPFVILSFGIITDLATTFIENIKYGIVFGMIMLLLIVPFSYKNYSVILDGYQINRSYHINNDTELKNTAKKIKNGEEVKSVTLQKLNNTICSNIMQYEDGFEFVKIWMCEYYDIPQNIEFNWVE
ncbi:DUF6056 family protein [Lachnotalea glycerini]|uniref:Glucosyltransferase GtrII-like protein n=1 Tax=Lachnotalea glycerini TaxID=1763509 RepID=A0A371JBX0_9FIRM|nr:DUF6056 family protein [Lachnotalea glycerini]RDY30232.1 hypothetical protein CG710_015880 [Lachnotalea glycerini]